jgi:hypothetical protein
MKKNIKHILINTFSSINFNSIKLLSFVSLILFFLSCKDSVPPTIIVEKNDETYAPSAVKPVLDKWQQSTFNFFWNGASPSGMAYEGSNRGDLIATGGSGFGIMAIIVGDSRGFITHDQATQRMQSIVRFIGKAERFKGVWSHMYNSSGEAIPFNADQVKTGDIVETGFMMEGLLAAGQFYTADTPIEKEIRDSVSSFWNTVDWKFYTNNENTLYWLWNSGNNQFSLALHGWNEALISYICALGAPTPHNISTDVYNNGWYSNGNIVSQGRKFYGYDLPLGEAYGGPMFFAHYSFLGLDPRLMQDNNVFYWIQNVDHAMINRHYCVYEAPLNWKYGEKDWGLTACYGAKPPLWNYLARSPTNDDGIIAPTATLGDMPYTPYYSIRALMDWNQRPALKGSYGFVDAYCPSTSTQELNCLAIDQGPIVVMIENYRSGLIWNLLMKNPDIKRALQLAGMKDIPSYQEGFYLAVTNTQTNEYDMIRHPDRGSFELNYFLNSAGNTHFVMKKNSDNSIVKDTTFTANAGINIFKFQNSKTILNQKQYTLKMTTAQSHEYSLVVRLR